MVTANGYNLFLESGGKQVNQGFYVIAESGGTALNGSPARAFPDREFFIDDLTFKTYCNTKSTEGPVGSIDFEFKITEPYGFSFTSMLKAKAAEITKNGDGLPNENLNTNPLKQFYVLGITFYGYNDEGNHKVYDTLAAQTGPYGQESLNGLSPSYYPISINDFSFRLDGKSTTYTIKAAPLSLQEAFGVKRSQIQNDFQVTGKTVEDVLVGNSNAGDTGKPGVKGVVEVLNKKEQDLVSEGKAAIANVFKIEIADDIKDAALTDNNRYDKSKTAMRNVDGSDQISGKNSTSNFSFDPNTRSITVTSGMTLVKFIDNTVLTSDYVVKSLSTVYNEDPDTGVVNNASSKKLQWFHINPIAKALGYDHIRKDYSYEITYYVAPYQIPYVKSTFVQRTAKTNYYGPFKVYEYYFTGKNTQVLNFEISYNKLYFLPGGSDTNAAKNTTGNDDTPIVEGQKNNGMENQLGKAGMPVGSIKTSIYNTGDQSKAKMTILGDPDLLMTTIGVSKSATNPNDAVFGPNNGANPNAGQIFIEVDFFEGVDYDDNNGLLKVNKNIEFFRYSDAIKDSIQGIVYMLNSVSSTFSKGKFTQDLELFLWVDPNYDSSGKTADGGRPQSQGFPLATDQVSATTPPTGFTNTNPPTAQSSKPDPNTEVPTLTQTNQSILNAVTTVTPTAGQEFVSGTNQSIVNTITQPGSGTPDQVVANPAAAFQQVSSTVVDDDSITNKQPALSYAGNHIAGRES